MLTNITGTYWILEGKTPVPCSDSAEWERWFEKADRTVAKDKINGYLVSTIFLGKSHTLEAQPLLFQTLFFKPSWLSDETYVYCYATWEEALEGHKEIIKKLNSKQERLE